ncbi:MAG: tRNA 4-thiouridine(8) synthase ThiI [Thaumarchaeota archaeon]|nr:tRNA 4-thiouridine(8) synthase ThiI [Nitrososphaerota archaeon]
MDSTTSLVVHYAEIGTKGANRSYFEALLERNLREKLERLGGANLAFVDQRLIIHLEDSPGLKQMAMAALRDAFGVAWFAEVVEAPLDYDGVRRVAVGVLAALRERSSPTTFRVTAKRANKNFELSSQELAIRLGDHLKTETGLGVDLSNPQATLFVDVLNDRMLVYTSKERGPGGLPVGVTGKVLHLLSGGIDSPVAAWLMMKRGCDLTYLHFFVAPSAEQIMETKMPKLAKILAKFGIGGVRLVLVPFDDYQMATADLRPEYEPIVFRHFMRIVAEQLAEKIGAVALSTGDNLGQVASQTLYNLACIDAGASIPTLRPLVGYDKAEIIRLAEAIGTYGSSIEEYKDCCSIVSRHPKTRMNVETVLEAAERYDFRNLAAASIQRAAFMKYDARTGAMSIEPLENAEQAKTWG